MRREEKIYYIKKREKKYIFNILFFKIFFMKVSNFNLNILIIELKRLIIRLSDRRYLIISIYFKL